MGEATLPAPVLLAQLASHKITSFFVVEVCDEGRKRRNRYKRSLRVS